MIRKYDSAQQQRIFLDVAKTFVKTPEQDREFRGKIDTLMGVAGRGSALKKTLDDAEFSFAQDKRETPQKRRWAPDGQGMAVMEAVKHVGTGGQLSDLDAKIIRTPAHVIRETADRVREACPTMKDTDTSLSFERKLRQECGQPTDAIWTPTELDNAVLDRILNQRVTMSDLTTRWGPSGKTIARAADKVLKCVLFGKKQGMWEASKQNMSQPQKQAATVQAIGLGREGLQELLSDMHKSGLFPKSGPQPLLSEGEATFLIGKSMLMADTGLGVTSEFIRAEMASALNEEGSRQMKHHHSARQRGIEVSAKDAARAKKMQEATVSQSTFARYKKRCNQARLLGGKTGKMQMKEGRGKKTSQLSHARAQTNNLVLTELMYEEILKTIQLMIKDGALRNDENRPLTELLDAHQILNGDEVGFDPNGNPRRVECFEGRRKLYNHCTGEHAPFWATVFSVTKADGTLLPPVVIHEGDDDLVSEANCMCGDIQLPNPAAGETCAQAPKPLPRNWLIRQSKSGYMTQSLWNSVADHIISYCPPAAGPYLLFIDGHHSHWNVEALRKLKTARIYVCFLRSNNSENDQPNDNGFNALQKAVYNKKLQLWRAAASQRALTGFRPWHFNEVYHEAWKEIVGTSGKVIQKAFRICGLFPLDKSVAMARDGAEATGIWAHQKPEQDVADFLGQVLPGPGIKRKVHDGTFVPAVSMTWKDGCPEIKLIEHKEGTPLTSEVDRCVLRWTIAKVVQQKAAQSADFVRAHREMKARKKNTVSIGGVKMLSAGQAVTTAGLCVDDHVLDALDESQRQKKLAEELAADQKQQKADRQQIQLQAAWATAHAIHSAWKEEGAEVLQRKKAAELQHAAHLLAGAAKNLKKQASIDAFVAWAEKKRANE